MRRLRIWLVGLGTVGRWLAGALGSQAERLAARYGVEARVVGIATARDGLVYDEGGLDLASVMAAASSGRSIAGQQGARCWPSALDGLHATEADLLVDVSASPPADGEPGATHMREALRRGIPVVTAVPLGLRGVLNATANFVLSQMADGRSYQMAPAEAQRTGLAERDPAADVEGHDAVAKVMILSGLVFGRPLRREQVACRGITGVTPTEIGRAASRGGQLKPVATPAFSGRGGAGNVTARVQPELVRPGDRLANIDGTTNAVVCEASPVGEIAISGPGAGPQLAGQGC